MNIEISGKNIEITSSIRQRIEEKVAKLEKWQVDIISCHATVSVENTEQKIEIALSIPKNRLVASAANEDLYVAINEAVKKLETQMNKLRHKHEARRHEETPVATEEE